MTDLSQSASSPPPGAQQPWALLDFLAGLSWRFLVCFFALAVAVFVLIQLSFIVVPLLIAILVSSILSPLASRLRRRGMSAGTAATATVALAILVLLTIAFIVVPPLITNADDFVKALKDGVAELDTVLVDPPFNLDAENAREIADKIQALGPKAEDLLVSGIGMIVPLVGQALVTGVLAIVMTGYILRDGDRYWQWMLGFVEAPRQPGIDAIGQNAYGTLAAYLRGTSLVALFNSGMITFGAFLLGLPLLGPLAITIFVAAFLPIVGAWIAAAMAIFIALASGGVTTAIAMGLIFLLVSQFKSYFISPFVIGTRVNLPPIITLSAVMVGTVLGGIAGGILAVPLTATITGALSQIRQWRTEGAIAEIDSDAIDPSPQPA